MRYVRIHVCRISGRMRVRNWWRVRINRGRRGSIN
jgi:hypothetical protein